MSSYAFAWRDRVADPFWLVWCACGHAEQLHDIGGCTAGPHNRRCICDRLTEKRREWVGPRDQEPAR